MLIVLIRTFIIYIVVVITMRIMGKQQIGQLQPFEFVIAILIADLAAIPMQNPEAPLMHGIIPILTLLVLQYLLSYVSLKSEVARGVICGKPAILIENGIIVESELKKIRYNINDLLEQLRIKDYPNISDVEFAILETKGELSIIPKSQKRAVMPEDLNIPTQYEGLPITLIIDGVLLEENLPLANIEKSWLLEELQKQNIQTIKETLFATLDTQGNLYVQKKGVR